MYRAGAAHGDSAAIFRARYAEFVSQDPEQRHVVFDIHLVRLGVDLQIHGRPSETELDWTPLGKYSRPFTTGPGQPRRAPLRGFLPYLLRHSEFANGLHSALGCDGAALPRTASRNMVSTAALSL